MAPPFLDWVAAMLDGTQTATDGAIVFLDYAMKEESRLEWTAALITEVAFPTADTSSKESARMRVTLHPTAPLWWPGRGRPTRRNRERRRPRPHARQTSSSESRGSPSAPHCPGGSGRRRWEHRCGCRPWCSRGLAGPARCLRSVFWLPESLLASVAPWFEDFVINGNNDSTKERTASLAYLDPSLKDELLRLEFDGVGIHRISPERQEDSAGVVALVKIETYCESVALANLPPWRRRRKRNPAPPRRRHSLTPSPRRCGRGWLRPT